MTIRKSIEYCTWAGTAFVCVLMVWMWSEGYLKDPAALQALLQPLGFFGVLAFVFLQAFQVIIPVIPGGVTCALGVLCFGPVYGFIYNYLGLVSGSLILFYLVRQYGRPFVQNLVKPETYDKYVGWLDKGKKFEYFFALAIFAPCAPDDVLCMIAGLTSMSYLKYTLIILMGKPLALLAYSMGLTSLFSLL